MPSWSAARSLVLAANRAGGDDNITAVLFELVEGPPAPAEPDERTREYVSQPDEEDTLHPEDAIAPPPAGASPTETEETSAPQAGLGRRLLALTVIVALIVVIVVLVWWGLAR